MNVLLPQERDSLTSHYQVAQKHARVLMGFAVPASLITGIALTALTVLGIYCKAYQLSLFDASLCQISGLCIALSSGFAPLLIYCIFLARIHQQHKNGWIHAHQVILKSHLPDLTYKFVLDEQMKGMQQIDKQFLIEELIRSYPNKKTLGAESDEIKILDVLEKAKEKAQVPPEDQDEPREDLGRRLREMDRMK
jgi:hypothetical protein